MNNELNTGSLETLTTGKCLLVDARIVKNGKISLHFAEVINTGSQPSQDEDQIDLLAHSMRYDESFSGGAQRRWLTTTVQAATEDYGIDFTDINGKQIILKLLVKQEVKVVIQLHIKVIIFGETQLL